MADFIPKKKLKGTNPLPWINGSIINLIKKKDSIRKILKQRASSVLREKFRSLRSEIKRRLCECREAFFADMESNLKLNLKRFWSILKVKSKHKNIPETITMATSDNSRVKASTPREVAELFNQYFVLVFASDQGTPAPDRENGQLPDSGLFLADVILSVSEVELTLLNLDASKASGPDELPAKILKETAEVIAPSLTQLFNKSLRLGCLPEDWKLANIVPVFKKDNKEQAENYRPISLLSIVSKVIERCLFNTIRDHVFNLISACQHGFRAKRSSVTQLVEVLDQIGTKLDRGGQVDIIYLDMSKAFDTVKPRKTPKEATPVWFLGEPANIARILPAQSIPASDYIGCNIKPLTCNFRGPTGIDPRPHIVPSVCELLAKCC